MTESTHKVGPRNWAVLVLAGGAALSAPFLRNPGNPAPTQDAAANPLEVDFSKKSWPDVREQSLTPPGQVTSNLSVQDWAQLERLKSTAGSAPRKVTGNLPSTSATPLPAWADRGPRVDQLVNDSIRAEPLPPAAPVGSAAIDPLRPWMGHGMKAKQDPSATPRPSDLVGGDALNAPNPDTRWNSVPSRLSNPEVLPRDSGALASNKPFRKFEDHVKQWPDEKLSPSQVAWDPPSAHQSDRNAASPSTSWPSVSRPSGFSVAGQATRLSPIASSFTPAPPVAPPVASLIAPATQSETVSAPMVSSQSGRQPPRLNSPSIEAPKPTTNTPSTSPRPKQFIQQPAKRA